MPLPWKKARATVVSGFISNLHSRRRRSPLLVHTGFPTSLVDLVLKNRYRLKKPSSKKKIAPADFPPVSPPRTTMPSFLEAPVGDSRVCDRSGVEFRESKLSCSVPGGFSNLSCEGRNVVGVSRSRCFSAILKVFLVVILALVTKEFAVGITASAVLLYFLEFAAKHVAFRRRECGGGLDVNRVKDSDLGSSDCKRTLELSLDDGDLVTVEKIQGGIVFLSSETQVTESDLDLAMGEKRSETKRELLAVGDGGNLIKVKRARNRKLGNVILKDKFLKKLVPKKFRSLKSERVCKEENLDSNSESSESKEGGGDDGHENGQEVGDEEVSSSETSNETSSLVNSEDTALSREIKCAGIKSHSGNLAIVVIVLFGLVGGRTVALLLTVAWFFLAKPVESGWRNLKKMCESGRLV